MENKISSGSFDLNNWLCGGYEKDIITMIVGPPACGKTNFSILTSCSQAKNSKVIFMDTEGGFCVERIKQIVGENHEKILENILLLEPMNFNEQKKCFAKLLETLKKQHVSLIVIDGIAMLYRLELGEASKLKNDSKVREVNKEFAEQMRILSEIARKQKIPVIITNQVYKGFLSEEDWKKGVKPEVNIVGGDLFKYWSKCIIELKNNNGKRKAVLLKHRSMDIKELNFEIKDKGVFKKGWI
jgi:DNA repair protein RadB